MKRRNMLQQAIPKGSVLANLPILFCERGHDRFGKRMQLDLQNYREYLHCLAQKVLMSDHDPSHFGVVIGDMSSQPFALRMEDHGKLFEFVVRTIKAIDLRINVVAATTTNYYRETAELMEMARRAGVDAVMVMVPYGIKTTQAGIAKHLKQCGAGNYGLPIILHDNPPRTGVSINPETMIELYECGLIDGVKYCNTSPSHADELFALRSTEMMVFCGDDAGAHDLLNRGADGLISITANLIPGIMMGMVKAYLNAQSEEAAIIFDFYHSLFDRVDTMDYPNPVPLNTALALLSEKAYKDRSLSTKPNWELIPIALEPMTAVDRQDLAVLLFQLGIEC